MFIFKPYLHKDWASVSPPEEWVAGRHGLEREPVYPPPGTYFLQSVPKIALTNLASFQAIENKADSFQGLPNKGDMVSWVEKHNPAAGGFCLFYFRLYKVCQANERVCACRGRLPGVVLIRTLYSNKSSVTNSRTGSTR
jgi:hypothetical protein